MGRIEPEDWLAAGMIVFMVLAFFGFAVFAIIWGGK